ncbi:MAG: hypothetical protein K2H29_11180 [Oscillospiraceae bacterium]|nr:hypothetical protein [Oscillospiraceae bacterium]
MFTVFVKYQKNSALLKLPCEVHKIRDVLSSIGCHLSEIPVLTDENAELTVKVYPYSEMEKVVCSKITENDSLIDLNTLAKYLDRQYSIEAKTVRDTDVSGIQNLYMKLSEPKQPETEKLVIHARLVRKELDFTPTACIVEHSIPLSQEEFFSLRNNPLQDHKIIKKYQDNMYCDSDGIRHCILVYDEKQGDGLLIDSQGADYARYAQYIPCARLLAEQYEQQMEQTAESEETPEISDFSL